MDTQVTPQVVTSVLEALENPKFRWRTIRGLSKEINLEADAIQKVIADKADMIVSTRSKDGEDLYTTRKHFRNVATVTERLLGAIKNRAL